MPCQGLSTTTASALSLHLGLLSLISACSPSRDSLMTPLPSLQVGTIFQPLLTYEMPPTYFRTDKVTHAFQEIVDAYGIARYR